VPAGEAFHLFPVAPADFILGTVAQEEVGVHRVNHALRIKANILHQKLRTICLQKSATSWDKMTPLILGAVVGARVIISTRVRESNNFIVLHFGMPTEGIWETRVRPLQPRRGTR